MNRNDALTSSLSRFQTIALGVGVIGLIALGAGAAVNLEQFFKAYLYGYLFCLGVPLGSLGLMMLHHLSGGRWGIAVRRLLEASAMTMPFMALLFIPIASTFFINGGHTLYLWANLEEVAKDPILTFKSPYLNVSSFLLRAAIYFTIWICLAFFLRQMSLEQDRTGNPGLVKRMRVLSGAGLALFVLSASFAAFDWGMSLDPHWFSSMYGVLFMVGGGLTTLAVLIITLSMLLDSEQLTGLVSINELHDLGKFMFAFVIIWAYMSFGQYLIIWSGDLAESVPWYVRRTGEGWQWIAVCLIFAHFFLPFILLLSRYNKRTPRIIATIAAWIVVMRLIDITWWILPEFHVSVLNISWIDIAAPLGIGGIWFWLFIQNIKGKALLPMKDPGMEALMHSGGHH